MQEDKSLSISPSWLLGIDRGAVLALVFFALH